MWVIARRLVICARLGGALIVGVAGVPSPSAAQPADALPSPLGLADVIRVAAERRDEIQASRARTRAGEARPTIVSALEDPMISPSLDHLPFMLGGANASLTIEQQIPLSGIRGHRRAAASADVDRLRADAHRTTLDVGVQAATAFLMLQERRETAVLVGHQTAFARDVVLAANARYASGTAPQSDVLRAEVEVARLEALAGTLAGEVRGAEAMLNTSLGRDADLPVPSLAPPALARRFPPGRSIKTALTLRTPARRWPRADRARGSRRAGDARHVPADGHCPHRAVLHHRRRTGMDGHGWVSVCRSGAGGCTLAWLKRRRCATCGQPTFER